MSKETVQFTEIIREEYYCLLEVDMIFLNIRQSELDGEISKEQANELREYYKKLGENHVSRP